MKTEDIDIQIRQCIESSNRILVTAHIRPDGDAIGAVLGMGLALIHANKKVQMVLSDGIPSSFNFLPGFELINKQLVEDYEISIVLDCSDEQRAGNVFKCKKPDINIDHHITNEYYAQFNLVDINAASTTAILAEHLPLWGLKITKEISDVLLTGLITDTIGFRTSNVTSSTLETAAKLMLSGADLSDLYEKALNRRSFQSAKYWGQGLQSIQRKGKILWATLTLEDRKISNYTGNDDADLINILSCIDGSDIFIIFIEQNEHHVKVSWRARPGIDVSQLAKQFGGGGHPAASGADIDGDLVDVQKKVLLLSHELLETDKSQLVKKNSNITIQKRIYNNNTHQ